MSYLGEKLPGQDPDMQDILKKHEPIGLGFLTGSVTEMITKLDDVVECECEDPIPSMTHLNP